MAGTAASGEIEHVVDRHARAGAGWLDYPQAAGTRHEELDAADLAAVVVQCPAHAMNGHAGVQQTRGSGQTRHIGEKAVSGAHHIETGDAPAGAGVADHTLEIHEAAIFGARQYAVHECPMPGQRNIPRHYPHARMAKNRREITRCREGVDIDQVSNAHACNRQFVRAYVNPVAAILDKDDVAAGIVVSDGSADMDRVLSHGLIRWQRTDLMNARQHRRGGLPAQRDVVGQHNRAVQIKAAGVAPGKAGHFHIFAEADVARKAELDL